MENNDNICPECDAAGFTSSLDIFGACDLCGTYPLSFPIDHSEPEPMKIEDYDDWAVSMLLEWSKS